MNFTTLCTILVTFDQETPEFTLLTIAPFAALQQKSAYHVKYIRISWIYLDLLYRFGRRIGGDDYPIVCLAVTQRTLLWQPVKFRGWSQASPGMTFFLALAFDNGLADRKSALKRLNGNIRATSCPNFVNFHPIIWEFTLLKRAILQRSSFVTLAFPNGLEDRNFDFSKEISNHFCTPCRNLVRFGSVTPEFKS